MRRVAVVQADPYPGISAGDIAERLFPGAPVVPHRWRRPAGHPAFELLSFQRWLSIEDISAIVLLQHREMLAGTPTDEKIVAFTDQVRLVLLVLDVATLPVVERVVVVGSDVLRRGDGTPRRAPEPDGDLAGLLQYYSEKVTTCYGTATDKASVVRWTGAQAIPSRGTRP